MDKYSLSLPAKVCFWISSFLLVAFGQPAWEWWIGLLASLFGFACFWRILLATPRRTTRFWLAMVWYASIQVVQLSWMFSHPYLYIYGVVLFCASLLGAQFGLVSLFIQPNLFRSTLRLAALASFWVILEWSRLFMLSGLAFNPVGIALTGAIYPLQLASVGGVYLLSFWVIFTNLIALKAWLQGFNLKSLTSWIAVAIIPYLFGMVHFHFHALNMDRSSHHTRPPISALLVQTAFSIEENIGFASAEEARHFVMDEWRRILTMVHQHHGRSVDLIVLPENVVPYGTYYPVFPADHVKAIFKEIFGSSALKHLPPLEKPYAAYVKTDRGPQWLVSNAFFAQSLANIFQSSVVIGLEDIEQLVNGQTELYTAAFNFSPYSHQELPSRYEKRVLVPMGEYIPFQFLRTLVARYGIQGSFTCGKEAKVFPSRVPFGPSICYEEMYGDLMRQSRVLGAELLVNLTNDGWYPHSRLPQQHFDHSRLRTVENGIPLIRACNTGITGAIDSLGRIIKVLGENPLHAQTVADAIHVEVPSYHYSTLYAKWGDAGIIGLCFCLLAIGLMNHKD